MQKLLEYDPDERSMFLYSNVSAADDELSYLILKSGGHIRNFLLPGHLQFGIFTYFAFMLTDKISHIHDYFNAYTKSATFQQTTKYFIAYLGNEDLGLIFAKTWLVYTERIIVMDRKLNFYTSIPLRKHCGKSNGYEYIFDCNNMDFEVIKSIFNYSFKSFYGCKVKVLTVLKEPFVINTTSRIPGMEVEFFNMAASKYNFTPVYLDYRNISWGDKTPDGNYTRMLRKLYDREGDVLFGNFFTNDSFTADFEVTYPYLQSDLAFYVPMERTRANWMAALHTFHLYVWIGAVLMYFFMYLTIYFFTNTLNNIYIYSQHYSFLGALGILLGKSVKQPKITILRVLFLISVLSSYILSSSYETRLLSLLLKPQVKYLINKDEDVIKSGLDFGGLRFAKDIFAKPGSSIYNKYVDCSLVRYCLDRTAFERNMATIDNTAYVKYFMRDYVDENGHPLMRQLPPSYSFFSWILMKKGFPILPLINNTIVRLLDHGFMQRRMRDAIRTVVPSKDKPNHSLDLNQLLVAFYLLLLGLLFSTLIFICEILFRNNYAVFS